MSKKFYFYGATSSSLILDTYPMDACYSFQKLRTSYLGGACQVLRDSDNALQVINFNGNQLDIAGLQSWLGASDGYVRRWEDQQNANNALQTTKANMPKIATAGVVELLNGEPTMVFSGNQWLVVPSTVYNGQANASQFIMADFEPSNNYEMLYTHSDGLGVLGRIEIRRSTTNNYLEWMLFSNAGATTGSIAINSVQNLYSAVGSRSGNAYCYVDGVQDATHATPVNLLGNYVSQIGARNGSFGFQGRIQEVLLSRANESANRAAIEAEILGRY